MSDLLERIVRIETTTEYIKASLDRLVDNTESHTLQSQKNAIEIVELKANIGELKSRLDRLDEKPGIAPLMSSSTKIAGLSATLASVAIAIIEYFKR